MPPKKETAPSIAVRRDALKGKSVIITGEIEGRSRKAAEEILVNAGAKIEKSLNKKVQLVILGEKAGPSKLQKIEDLGCETQDWDELIEQIKSEGGEEPAADDDDDDEDEDEDDEEMEDEPEEKPKAQKAKGKAKANTKAKADPAPKAKAVSAPKAKAVSAPKAKASAASSDSSIAGKKVIITGTISGYDRKGADAVLEDAGAEICKSLNKQVEVVIIGTNAGPTKMAKIEEMGLETISWNDLVEELGLEAAPEKKVANVDAGDAPDSIDGMTVLVTGTIEGHTRGDAQKMLESAGAKVAKSLNKQVELAILGSKPGPDKLNKIAEEGIPTCSFVDLVEKLGLEAEASEPPKKKSKKN